MNDKTKIDLDTTLKTDEKKNQSARTEDSEQDEITATAPGEETTLNNSGIQEGPQVDKEPSRKTA